MVFLSELGWKAVGALARAGGRARVLAPLSSSLYLTAGDEILWLGRTGAPRHPRVMLTPDPLPAPDRPLELDAAGARQWTPPAPPCSADAAWRLAEGCHALAAAVGELGTPGGFGALLAGATPSFPLDHAAARALALAAACGAGEPDRATDAAGDLLGLGPGLTPSGDDYVGGAFFARTLLANAGAGDAGAWAAAGTAVLARAATRTHPISLALLGDMLTGQTYAPLHELATALADGAARAAALDAARRLVTIGHSSGWDMLAGFVAGVLGAPGFTVARELG